CRGEACGAARTTAKCYAKHQPAPLTAARNVILALEYGPMARPERHQERLILSSTQGRRPGRPSRAARSSEEVDRQTLMLRRSIGLGAAVVVAILLVVGINGCLDNRKTRAFEDYASDERALARGSSELSDRLFTLLSKPSRSDALDVQTQVNAERAEAEQLVERAKSTDHPDELDTANGWL